MTTIDIRITQSDPSGKPSPDPEGAAAFWRALPKTTPTTALDAALRCVAAGRPVYPVWLIWDAAAGKFSKPAAVDAYYHVATSPDEHGVDDKGRPARFSTLDPDTCRAWWGRGGPFARCGVGAVLAPDAFALDADDDAAAAWLAGAVIDSADTWIIHGGRGARAVYRRPAWVADVKPDPEGWRYSVRRRTEDGPAVAGGCDVVGGVLVVWTPGAKRRSWTGGPERIADPTPALDAVLHAALDPLPRPPVPVTSGPVVVPDGPRGMRYVGTALERLWRDLAPLTEGRQNALWKAGKAAGRALARAGRPDLATWAEDQLAGAAPWADTRRERDTIRRGIAAGLRQVGPGLVDRALRPRATSAPATGPDAAAIRAGLAEALAALPDDVAQLTDDDGRRVHYRRRETIKLKATHLLTAMHDAGRAEHCEAIDRIGLAIGRGKGPVLGALPYLARLGIEVTIGGINDDGTARATRFVFFPQYGPRPLAAGGAIGAEPGERPLTGRSVVLEKSLTEARCLLAAAGDDVTWGLRRRSKPDDRTTGDYSAEIVAALRAADGPLDADDVAARVGCHYETARRALNAAVARGVAVVSKALAPGRGRPRKGYALTEVVTPAVEAVCALGAAAKARAVLAIEVARDRLRKARALVLRGVGTVKGWLAMFAARTRAERRAAAGGELGRPEHGRDEGVRALHVAATWVLDGWRQANPTPPAELETPPTWAIEAVPLW